MKIIPRTEFIKLRDQYFSDAKAFYKANLPHWHIEFIGHHEKFIICDECNKEIMADLVAFDEKTKKAFCHNCKDKNK